MEAPVRVASFPLLDAWKKAEEGDGAARGNFFAQQASFWEDWGGSESDGLLIAPDGAGGNPEVDYMTLGRWALLPAADDTLAALVEMGREDAKRWARTNGWDGRNAEESVECGAGAVKVVR